jgi:hypothetical protein
LSNFFETVSMKNLTLVIVLLSVCVVAVPLGSGAAVYSLINLSNEIPIPGGHLASVVVNEEGDVAGTYRGHIADPNISGYWRYVDAQFENLGNISDPGLGAVYAFNSNQALAVAQFPQSFSVPSTNIPEEITGSATEIEAFGMNELNQIVGESDLGAFVWAPGGMIEILPGLDGAGSSRARDINNFGWIVGEGDASSTDPRNAPILWVPGEPALRIGGDGFFGRATDINDDGGILGESGDEVFFWRDGNLLDGFGHLFQELNGNTFDITDRVLAGGINDSHQAVGTSAGTQIGGGPFSEGWLWTEDDGIVFLDDLIDPALGIDIYSALDINNRGQILVNTSQGFALLTPIPEPSRIILILFSAFIFTRRHRS